MSNIGAAYGSNADVWHFGDAESGFDLSTFVHRTALAICAIADEIRGGYVPKAEIKISLRDRRKKQSVGWSYRYETSGKLLGKIAWRESSWTNAKVFVMIQCIRSVIAKNNHRY